MAMMFASLLSDERTIDLESFTGRQSFRQTCSAALSMKSGIFTISRGLIHMNDTKPETRPAATWVRWQIVALLVSFSFMTWFNRVSLQVAYDERIKEETNISEEAIGSVSSTFLFAYMVCMTPGGWFIDRYGPRLALVVMGFGSALFGALTGLAGLDAILAAGLVLPALLVIRFIMGIFTAPFYPASSRSISFWMPPHQRALANGFVQSAAAFGIACVFPIFGTLIDLYDWPIAFVISGGFTAFLAILWTLLATDRPGQHAGVNEAERQFIGVEPALPPYATVPSPSWWHLFRNRSLVLLTISYAAVGYFEYLYFFWMRFYFKDVLNLGKEDSRVYATIVHLALAAGMILGGVITDHLQGRWGHGRGRCLVPMLGMTGGAVFLWLGMSGHGTAWIVSCLAIALGCVGASEASVWTTATELGGNQGGTAAAICNTGGNLGGLFAPILTPFVSHLVVREFGVSEQVGWQWGISLGIVICLVGGCLWWWIDPHERVAP
jgi:ACS family D-galactonate transporter-like MFS transporter